MKFKTVYAHMAELVNYMGKGNRFDVSESVNCMHICGNTWMLWAENKQIPQSDVEDWFTNLAYVMTTVQTVPELQNEPRVKYLVNFLKIFPEEIAKFKLVNDQKELFSYVKSVFRFYKPPPLDLGSVGNVSLVIKKPVVKVEKGDTTVKGRAKLTSLLRDLRDLRA